MGDDHYRKRLPETRRSLTHKAVIIDDLGGEHDLYITLGYYDDGSVGEVFLNMGKQGSTIKGLLDGWAIMVSMGIQYGVPLDSITAKFHDVAFEPSGRTDSASIPKCKSIFDYVARYLEAHPRLEEDHGSAAPAPTE